MKYEKQVTTKDGRRTWKVTYELVHGPEPKRSRKARQGTSAEPAASKPSKRKTNKAPKRSRRPPKPARGSQVQLGMF